jgi:formylglycine-generating enzyme
MKKPILSLLAAVGLIGSAAAQFVPTETFGSGANQFSLDFTFVGNPGNAVDTNGYGSVGYDYAIGTYSISQNQLKAAETIAGVSFGSGGGGWTGDQPAGYLSWYQAASFVNWLDTSTGHQAAYNLKYTNGTYSMSLWQTGQAGYDTNNPFRNSQALYVLPSDDEFYKAAYGLSNGTGYTLFADGSNTLPTAVTSGTNAGTAVYINATNGLAPSTYETNTNSQPASVFLAGGKSSYGAMGMEGNVFQWVETSSSRTNDSPTNPRMVRGGDYRFPDMYMQNWKYSSIDVGNTNNYPIGFRVAEITSNAVPEPSTYALFGLGAIGMLMVMRRKKTA